MALPSRHPLVTTRSPTLSREFRPHSPTWFSKIAEHLEDEDEDSSDTRSDSTPHLIERAHRSSNVNWRLSAFDSLSVTTALSSHADHDGLDSGNDLLDPNEQKAASDKVFGPSDGTNQSPPDHSDQTYNELSRRADLILENAKKRLMLMDRNLKGARALTTLDLLTSTRDSLGSTKRHLTNNRLHLRINSHVHRDQHKVAPLRTQSAMARNSLATSSVSASSASPASPERALGESAAWTANSLRGTRSHESLNTPRTQRDRATSATREDRLGTLPESDTATSTPLNNGDQPSPLTHDLQHQMRELKARISFLKDRAQRDSLRRQSQNSHTNSSPLTDADNAYHVSSEHHTPSLVMSGRLDLQRAASETDWQDAAELPGNVGAGNDDDSGMRTPPTQMALSVDLGRSASSDSRIDWTPVPSAHLRHTSSATAVLSPGCVRVASIRGSIQSDQNGRSGDGSQVTELVGSETVIARRGEAGWGRVPRHEDRQDAFDYQHYFLHSGASKIRRRSSISTTESNATARESKNSVETHILAPHRTTPDTLHPLRHQPLRMHSIDSMNSTGSFTTAIESMHDGRTSPRHERDEYADVTPTVDHGPERQLGLNAPNGYRQTATNGDLNISLNLAQNSLTVKDRLLLEMLLDSLRRTCHRLQVTVAEQGEDDMESRTLRNRIRDATSVLNGLSTTSLQRL